MTFAGPIAAQTIATIAAVAGGLVIVAYILKLRRRRFEVPFSKLWQRVLREKETTSLWRRLKRLLSLLVQLVFVGMLLLAALDPRVGEAKATGRNVVLVIDASASMKALDQGPEGPARVVRAREEARRILRGLGGADAAMVIQMDGQATALSRFETDTPRLLQAVDRVEASDTPADLGRALSAAADALRGRKHPMIVIVGDGAYPDAAGEPVLWEGDKLALGQIDLRGIDVRFAGIGQAGRNVGITAFNVRRYLANKLSYEVLLEVQSFSDAAETARVTLYSGDDAIDVKTLTLAPGERRRAIYPDLGGGDSHALRAVLALGGGPDAFPLDDTAYALLPERRKQRVLLVSHDNLYLEGALLLDENITVDKLTPEEYPREAAKLPLYDVIVYDGLAPAGPPPASAAVYFDPGPSGGPFEVKRELARPFITDVEKDHPIMRWVTLADVNMDRSSVFATRPDDVVLARSIRDPLIVAGKRDGRKVVAFGFGLDGTDLTLRVAFPVMVVNMLDWFAGDDAELITTYKTGKTWAIPLDDPDEHEVSVKGPQGAVEKAPVKEGRARFYGRQVGVYRVQASERTLELAANLSDPRESNIKPGPKLSLGGRELAGPPTFSPSVSRSIWIWLALGALVLSATEWWTYHRRYTV